MNRVRFLSIITTVVATITGLALIATAGTGLLALIVHSQRGDTSSALAVGLFSIAAFLVSLVFLLPSALRRMIELSGKPGYRGPITFATSLVLLAVLLASAVSVRASGNLVFGTIPRGTFYGIMLMYFALFLLLFVYPGFGFPARRQREAPPVHDHKPRVVQGFDHIKSPWLRRAITVTIVGHLVIWVFAFYALLFANVVPKPVIVETNRSYLVWTIILSIVPLSVLIAAQPIIGGQTLMDHVRVKRLMLLGLGAANGAACIALPERGLPIIANAVLEAKLETQSYQVISAKAKSGLRGCGAKVVVLLNPETGRSYDLCRVPVNIAERAKSGDMLDVIGTSAGFGMTIEGFKLR